MSYQIKKLLPRHMKVMNLLLLGKKQKEIAVELDLSPQAVCSIVNSPVFRERLEKRRGEVLSQCEKGEPSPQELLDMTAIDSVKKLAEMLNSEDDRVVLKAAIDILDRSGNTGPSGVYRSRTVIFTTGTGLRDIMEGLN